MNNYGLKLTLVFIAMLMTGIMPAFAGKTRGKNHKELVKGDPGYEIYEKARQSNYESDSCLIYAEQLMQISKEQHFELAEMYGARIRLRYYKDTHKFESALKAANEMADISKKYDNTKLYFEARDAAVNILVRQQRVSEAFKLATHMEMEADRLNDTEGKFKALQSKALIFSSRKEYFFARSYYYKAINLNCQKKSSDLVHLYKAVAFTFPIDSDSTAYYFDKALSVSVNLIDSLRIYVAKAIECGKENDSTGFYNFKAIYDKLADNDFRSSTDTWEMGLYDAMFKHDRSKIDSILMRVKGEYIRLSYDYETSKNMGDYTRALKCYERCMTINDSINSITSSDILMDIERSIKLAQNQQVVESQINQEIIQLSTIILVAFFLVVLIILVSFIYSTMLNNRNLQTVTDMKTMFVQNMSHEVRTPLNAIVGFAQLLSLPEGVLTDEEKLQYTDYIMTSSDLLVMLVDDIQSISDIESGNYRITSSKMSCNEAARSAMKTAELRVPGGVNMYFTTELDDSFQVVIDRKRVIQILVNYLGNACKHTKQGEIHVHVSLKETPGYVTFSVADTGTGVPAEQAEVIFERFSKLDNFTPGTGLGLSICRMIATRLHGVVKLDTSYTGGARFILTIPIDTYQQQSE